MSLASLKIPIFILLRIQNEWEAGKERDALLVLCKEMGELARLDT